MLPWRRTLRFLFLRRAIGWLCLHVSGSCEQIVHNERSDWIITNEQDTVHYGLSLLSFFGPPVRSLDRPEQIGRRESEWEVWRRKG
ncbi:hypothetical protein EV127DRAFT_105462 [Xylaria flabelliformis]|nr:hypothetical protein EV127DRAFT_105462 [Xylaria flabelliformis]